MCGHRDPCRRVGESVNLRADITDEAKCPKITIALLYEVRVERLAFVIQQLVADYAFLGLPMKRVCQGAYEVSFGRFCGIEDGLPDNVDSSNAACTIILSMRQHEQTRKTGQGNEYYGRYLQSLLRGTRKVEGESRKIGLVKAVNRF